MAKKGPIIAVGAITGALFFWRRKRKKSGGDANDTSEVAAEEVKAEA